jgi:hypothetical protein
MTAINREQYLLSSLDLFRPLFESKGSPVPTKVRVSCGWPSRNALAKKKPRVGEAWSSKCSSDETFEIFVSPSIKEAREVLATLVHEMVHCAVGVEKGHRGPFKKLALAVGLVGKMTATTAGDELLREIDAAIVQVGQYPHAELKSSTKEKKPQVCRQLKVICKECGCICRMSQKCIDDPGCPICACGGAMEPEESDDDV